MGPPVLLSLLEHKAASRGFFICIHSFFLSGLYFHPFIFNVCLQSDRKAGDLPIIAPSFNSLESLFTVFFFLERAFSLPNFHRKETIPEVHCGRDGVHRTSVTEPAISVMLNCAQLLPEAILSDVNALTKHLTLCFQSCKWTARTQSKLL